MGIQQRLRALQDRLRDAGWRIKHIPWHEDDKLEVYGNTPPALLCVIPGIGAFLGGIWLITRGTLTVAEGVSVSVTGLLLLFLSRFVAGFFLYRKYVPVDAVCLDIDIQEFEDADPDSGWSFRKKTFWSSRILCEHRFGEGSWCVTPMMPKRVFATREKLQLYLDARMDSNRRCRLWVNPENPMQTIFHNRPCVAIHS